MKREMYVACSCRVQSSRYPSSPGLSLCEPTRYLPDLPISIGIGEIGQVQEVKLTLSLVLGRKVMDDTNHTQGAPRGQLQNTTTSNPCCRTAAAVCVSLWLVLLDSAAQQVQGGLLVGWWGAAWSESKLEQVSIGCPVEVKAKLGGCDGRTVGTGEKLSTSTKPLLTDKRKLACHCNIGRAEPSRFFRRM